MSSIRIDRCVCYNRTFTELKALAEQHNCTSVEELQVHVEFGLNCRLCHAYVRTMLRTGETEFDRIIES